MRSRCTTRRPAGKPAGWVPFPTLALPGCPGITGHELSANLWISPGSIPGQFWGILSAQVAFRPPRTLVCLCQEGGPFKAAASINDTTVSPPSDSIKNACSSRSGIPIRPCGPSSGKPHSYLPRQIVTSERRRQLRLKCSPASWKKTSSVCCARQFRQRPRRRSQ